jgi:HAD superfamily hydrolase (TIGR01549 family)
VTTAPRTVLFDAGLTLLYNHTSTLAMAKMVLGHADLPFEDAQLVASMQLAETKLSSTWHRGDYWGSEASVRGLFRDAYALGLVELPCLADRPEKAHDLAEAMYAEFADVSHWSLYPDVLPTLDALRGAGAVMGVISDWGHGLEALLLELGLGPYFDCLVVSSRLGISKPSADVFLMALERLGASPDETVYVGDTYVKDVIGARAAGIQPILLDRAGRLEASEVEADCPVIDDLRRLVQWVVPSEYSKPPP